MLTDIGDKSKALREHRLDIEEFNYAYAETLDAMDVDEWVEYFTEDAFYHVIARDNAESGLPLGLILRRQSDDERSCVRAFKHRDVCAKIPASINKQYTRARNSRRRDTRIG